jgi:hypothetical protein
LLQFNDPDEVEQVCYQMKLADYPRAKNRASINKLFNGHPPYSEQEAEENNIVVNVNDLASTRISHDARSQFSSAFMKPGQYFKGTTDMGPKHERTKYSTIFSRNINRPMKRSLDYFECLRSKFASLVLHGIGPAAWRDRDVWCPDPIGIEDVFVPANTLLTMRNLPFFAVYRSFTAPELIKMTRGPNVDSGWNQSLIKSCIEYIDVESKTLMGNNWPEAWAPEKMEERQKGDGGFYVGDAVPTINVFDFYFWNDDKKASGWNRRMIMDAWTTNDGHSMVPNSKVKFGRGEFLFDSKGRKYADRREELIGFQFADLSAVAPFRYHSVRSLGLLLYSVCHLQNRMRGKVNEAIFESLMMYFKVRSMDEGQRALKLMLSNRGLIDDNLTPIPANERYQVDANLIALGLNENKTLIEQNSSSYTQNQNFSRDKVEKTKFQVMAEVNAITSLVSAALLQAYEYQKFEYYEIVRRFMRKNSRDKDVRAFRNSCMKEGIPEALMVAEAWEIEPERVMGAGNKTLEMAIAQQLMEYRNLLDPEPQRTVLRDVIMAVTDDAARAEALVPEAPVRISDSVHDAQLASSSLMMGLPVAVKTGMNHIEYVETLLASMATVIKRCEANGKMATLEQIIGLQNMEAHINAHIQIIAQDPKEKARVKVYGDQLGKLMNLVKAYAQRLQQQMQEQNGNGQPDPEAMAKIQIEKAKADQKIATAKESGGQRTAQRQIQFEMEQEREDRRHQAELQREQQKADVQLNLEAAKAELQMKVDKAKAQQDIENSRIAAEKKPAPKKAE